MDKLGMEPKDLVTAIIVLVSMAMNWGAVSNRLSALEKAVEPVPAMHTDIEIVKAALIDIRDDLKAFRRNR